MGNGSDPDEATDEAPDEAVAAQLWAGPVPARAAVVLDTDGGARRLALAAGEALALYDAGAGCWAPCPGAGGVAVTSLDFGVDGGSGARVLVAGGWSPRFGPTLLLSRGVMAGVPAGGCDWVARPLPLAGAGGDHDPAPTGKCFARVDPADPQRIFCLVVPGPGGGSGGGGSSSGGSLWTSPDLGATWLQLNTPTAAAVRGMGALRTAHGVRLSGLALCATRPGRLLLSGTVPALAPGQVPVNAEEPALAPAVFFSPDGGETFADLTPAVAAAAEPAAAAAAARHRQYCASNPGHAGRCRHLLAGSGPVPLFAHACAVLGLADGQLLFNADVGAGAPWHAACQLPGAVTALCSDDGL
jgi:hypothetical protein